MAGRRAKALARPALALCAALACSPSAGPFELEAAHGYVVDADSGEPIRDALVIQSWRGGGVPGSERPVYHARVARSDRQGAFHFAREAAPSPRMWTLRTYGPELALYHPSYGLVRGGRADAEGRLRLAASLRDSALRIADAESLCHDEEPDAAVQPVAGLACPPGAQARWPDGTPRAEGAFDARGRRTGGWLFRYESGHIAARGRYRRGTPVGVWEFFDRRSELVVRTDASGARIER